MPSGSCIFVRLTSVHLYTDVADCQKTKDFRAVQVPPQDFGEALMQMWHVSVASAAGVPRALWVHLGYRRMMEVL